MIPTLFWVLDFGGTLTNEFIPMKDATEENGLLKT